MINRFVLVALPLTCFLFFMEGCALFDPCYFKSHSSGFMLDADTDIPKRIGIIRFQRFDPTRDVVNDEFSNHLKKLGFDVVVTDEYRGAVNCHFYCGPERVKMEKNQVLVGFLQR